MPLYKRKGYGTYKEGDSIQDETSRSRAAMGNGQYIEDDLYGAMSKIPKAMEIPTTPANLDALYEKAEKTHQGAGRVWNKSRPKAGGK